MFRPQLLDAKIARVVCRRPSLLIGLVLAFGTAGEAVADGSIFLTGHDPDFHSQSDVGAQHINQAAISFILDPLYNTYSNGGVHKFLFVESKGSVPGGHLRGVNGMTISGYANGVDFEHHDFSTLDAELDQLGTKYAGIVVASDFGGLLRQAELDILNTRSTDIVDFLNDGGGLYAMAEGNGGAHLTPTGGHFGYLPFVVSSTPADQSETGITLTAFGASIGLTSGDVNGNFSHNVFDDDFGLSVVDYDSQDRILTLAGRGMIVDDGVIPAPGAALLAVLGYSMLGGLRRRRESVR